MLTGSRWPWAGVCVCFAERPCLSPELGTRPAEAGRGIRSGRVLPGATASSSGPGGLAAAPRARRALSPPLVSESHDQVGHDRYMNCHSSVFTMGRGRG